MWLAEFLRFDSLYTKNESVQKYVRTYLISWQCHKVDSAEHKNQTLNAKEKRMRKEIKGICKIGYVVALTKAWNWVKETYQVMKC